MTVVIPTTTGNANVVEREDFAPEAFICNAGNGLEPTVRKDSSITGNGSTANPLSVVQPTSNVTTTCTETHTLLDGLGATFGTIELRDRCNVVQAAHGFTIPTNGVLPLVYNNTLGQWELAQADVEENVADVLAVALPDGNTITLQNDGKLTVPGHGLTVGIWYALDPATPGALADRSTLDPVNDIIQCAVFPLTAECLLIKLHKALVPVAVSAGATCACENQNQAAHGFSVGQVLTQTAGVWALTAPGEDGNGIVLEVIDTDNFRVGLNGCIESFTGIVEGVTYAVDPGVSGGLIDVTLLDPTLDPIQPVGYATDNECLIVNMLSCPKNEPITAPLPIFQEGFQNTPCGFENNPVNFETLQQIGPGPFFGSPGVDSSCYMLNTEPPGSTSHANHFWKVCWSPPLTRIQYWIDCCWVLDAGATFNGSDFAYVEANTAALQDGPRVQFTLLPGLSVQMFMTDTDGSPPQFINVGAILNDNWYRFLLKLTLELLGLLMGQ